MQNDVWCLSERVVFSEVEDRLSVINLERGTSFLFDVVLLPWFESLQQPKHFSDLAASLSSFEQPAQNFLEAMAREGLVEKVNLAAQGKPASLDLTGEQLAFHKEEIAPPLHEEQLSGLAFGGLVVLSLFVGPPIC